jgi:REP element-mobilizing transposase RayT
MKDDSKKHNRRSDRLRNFDYSQEGMYYVTIRTKNAECFLGNVVEGVMKLSEEGAITDRCWREIPDHFPNAELDVFQIMPNHVHGIVIIKMPFVRTRHAVSLREEGKEKRISLNRFGKPISGSLSTIVGSFKSAVSKQAHLAGHKCFSWHGRFYHHIIRDGRDLDRIRRYILNNPINWESDDNHPGNIRMDRMHEGEENWSALD